MKFKLIKQLLALGLMSVGTQSFAQFVEPNQVSVCAYGRAEALTETTIKRATVVHVSSVEIATSQENRTLGAVVGGCCGWAGKQEQRLWQSNCGGSHRRCRGYEGG